MIAVDIAHWPEPFGWLFRNTTGNLVSSAIAFVAGWMLKGRQIMRRLNHNHEALHHIIKHHPDIPDLEQK